MSPFLPSPPLERHLGAWLHTALAGKGIEAVDGANANDAAALRQPASRVAVRVGVRVELRSVDQGQTPSPDAVQEALQDNSGEELPGSPEQVSAVLLAQIEQLEAQRAALDAQIVQAYGALHTSIEAQVQEHADRRSAAGLAPLPATDQVSVAELVIDEVTLATAAPPSQAWALLRLGAHPRRYMPLMTRLASGTASLIHTSLIAGRVARLAEVEGWDEATHTRVLESVATRVLAPAKDGTRPAHRLILDRLTRVLTTLRDPDKAAERRHLALTRRSLHTELDEDGMGTLRLHAPAEHVIAVADRIESATRALRAAGDARTLEQLRADLAVTALLTHPFGPCPTHTTGQAGQEHLISPDHGQGGHPVGLGLAPNAVGAPSIGEVAGSLCAGWCGCSPPAPAANVFIVVPFEVASGSSEAPCELPGHGWVTAEHARAIITAPGSQWAWLGVDSVTGQALELSTHTYRPTRAMTAQVQALDGHCRAPGCTRSARSCDIDHHDPWPSGRTAVGNLGPLHRHHHNLKTAGYWSATRLDAGHDSHGEHVTGVECGVLATLAARDDRGLAWRTLAGRAYATYPKSWTEALHDPTVPDHPPPGRLNRTEPTANQAKHHAPRPPGWDAPPPF